MFQMAGTSSKGQAVAFSDNDRETQSESSQLDKPGEVASEEPTCLQLPPFCANCEVYSWRQKKNLANLLPCSGCSKISYCGEDCRKEHWVKVHRHHCAALAGPGGGAYGLVGGGAQEGGRCRFCDGMNHHEKDCPARRKDNPTYPCVVAHMVRNMKPLPPSLLSHHPFPLTGLPGDRTERIIIILQKLLLKMIMITR